MRSDKTKRPRLSSEKSIPDPRGTRPSLASQASKNVAASSEDDIILRSLVGGIDINTLSVNYRDFLCLLFGHADPHNQKTTLATLLRLRPERRDPILAYMLWHRNPVVRNAALDAISTWSALPEFLRRAVVVMPSLRARIPAPLVAPPHTNAPSEGVPESPFSACRVSIPDGSGHVTFFLAVHRDNNPRIIMILLHVLKGIVNMEILPFASAEARDRSFASMCADLDVQSVASANIHHLLREFLLLNVVKHQEPPPQAVDLLPFLWKSDIQRLASYDPTRAWSRKTKTAGLISSETLCHDSVQWVKTLPLLASWMSASALQSPHGDNTTEKMEHIYYCLEQDRVLWRANLHWTSLILSYCAGAEKRLASGFSCVARLVEEGTPLREIALFRQIAYRTFMAISDMFSENRNNLSSRLFGTKKDEYQE